MSEKPISDTLKKLYEYSESQKTALDGLQRNIKLLENSDIIYEYENLKSEFDNLSEKYNRLSEKYRDISEENNSLRNTLSGQIFSMRMSAVKTSEKNLEIFFGMAENSSLNALTDFENRVKARIKNMRNEISVHHTEAAKSVSEELEKLSHKFDEVIQNEKALHSKDVFTEEEKRYIESLKTRPLSDEQIKKAAKKNNFETFIGSNLINKIGIILIVAGVIALLRFSSFNAPNEIKSVIMLLFGALFIVCGEVMSRKKAGIFSVGCTACGIAVLFATLGVSYFAYKILSVYAALFMCVLITAAAFFLSARYKSQTIFSFALIGGYMPLSAIFENDMFVYPSMIYFMILSAFSLISAFKFKWRVCAFIGTALNIMGTYCIVIIGGDFIMPVIYQFVSFMIYTAIPIIMIKSSGGEFKVSDVVMLSVNTVFGSLLFYFSFDDYFGSESFGILSVILTVIYAAAGYIVGKNRMRPLFFITALAFSVMIIPMQFGKAWLSLAWLAEGVLLTLYGILRDEKIFCRYGLPVFGLCVLGFLFVDVMMGIDFLFAAKYTAVTLSAVMITACYAYKREYKGFVRVFKYLSAVNLWFYIIYISTKISSLDKFGDSLGTLAFLSFTFALAYMLLRLRAIYDKGTKILAYIFYSAGLTASLFMNTGYIGGHFGIGTKVICGSIIVIGDILCILSMIDFMRNAAENSKYGIQWYPVAVSVYLVILIFAEMTDCFGLSFTNMLITVIYASAAVLQIIIGFICRFPYLRRFGLALSLASAVKLFIFDLSGLSGGYRIICYFLLGASFMAISFVYQIFGKRFAETEADGK